MDNKEFIELNSLKDIVKFVLKKACFKRVRDIEFKIYTNYNKKEYLCSLLVDSCLVFNSEFMAVALSIKNQKTLLPCIINPENYNMVKDVLYNILFEVTKEELDIDISKEILYIMCTYRTRNILHYNVKKDTLEKVEDESFINDFIDTLGDFMIDFDLDYEEDDDNDDRYNV